ncbi:MAG: polysaccharide deacetylase family protein [Thermoleophilia bacterium]
MDRPTGDEALALTFDDGPDPVWTTIVLRELARLDARATFFVIAPRAVAAPRQIEAMLRGGHEVGLHCWAHDRHSRSARHRVEDETDRALEALAALGAAPRLWRTPWGDTAPWSEAVAASRGLTLTGWTADTHDWRGDTAEEMLAAVRLQLAPGASVLMHDGIGPGARRTDCLHTVRLIPLLHRHATERGWRLGPLDAPVAA